MTQRERSSERSSAAPPRRTGPAAPSAACPWDDLFRNAPPAQQRELLALAARQGVVYAHQLPTVSRRPLLPALLNGQCDELKPFQPPEDPGLDPTLDPSQREAVLSALHTPDVCLIQGGPGTGKSRVAAEIIARATARGDRVLLMAASAAALERVLEELARRESVCAVRCVGAGEKSEELSHCMRRLTFADRLRSFEEQTLRGAREAFEDCRRHCEIRTREETVWSRFEELSLRQEQIGDAGQRLNEELATVQAAVEAECGATVTDGQGTPFQTKWQRRKNAHADATAKLQARIAELRAETSKAGEQIVLLEQRQTTLAPLAEARRGGRWWSAGWWRARFAGNVVEQLENTHSEVESCQTKRTCLEAELAANVDELARLSQEHESESVQLRDAEIARRQSELGDQLAALEQEQRLLEEKWTAARQELNTDTPLPADRTAGAVREARMAWDALRRRDAEKLSAAKRWAEAVEQAWPTLPERLLACVNVAAATTGGLSSDAQFGDRAQNLVAFDLLVLEEAEHVTESEFLSAARRAERWVLLGEPTPDPDRPQLPRQGAARPGRPSSLRPGFFQRLWQRLHDDPRRLPYAWLRRDGRLVCRLMPVLPEQEGWIEREHVADRPDIELRIVSPPRRPPQLAEVVFPGSWGIPEAKEYIYRELQELPVQGGAASAVRWVEREGQLCLLFQEAADAVVVPLEQGVRERVSAATGTTCALEFDRAEGWDRARAGRWVEDHLKLRLLSRTIVLPTAHRMNPPLAVVIGDLLAGSAEFPDLFGPMLKLSHSALETPAVEFVAVPSLSATEPRRREESEGRWRGGGTATVAPRHRATRGGAGLEMDLTDRRFDAIPSDLRALLPSQGLVNYLEAQALVRHLEALVSDASFQTRAAAWMRQGNNCHHAQPTCEVCSAAPALRRPALAVIALYPAQVELIRRLIERSALLAASPVGFEVGLPSTFRQRECLAALVSLTRSHTHRAVTFGEGPHALTIALTRASEQLLLFGDPGTLARRAQWSGPVDHLDETAAARERAMIARLSHYIHDPATHPSSFRLRESCSV
jgi:hypothetical protein